MFKENRSATQKSDIRGNRTGLHAKQVLAAVLVTVMVPAGAAGAKSAYLTQDLVDTLILPGIDSEEIQKIDDVSVLASGQAPTGTASAGTKAPAAATAKATAKPTATSGSATAGNDDSVLDTNNELEVLPGMTVYVPGEDEQADFLNLVFSETQLKEGMTSPQVASLQQRLMELEYFENDEVTDYFGPVTEYSVELFQRAHDLQVDGIAGGETLRLLYSKDAKVYTIYPGNIGLDVTNMQERLKELGYYTGKATGKYDTATEKAVRAFQKLNGLVVDAKMGTDSRDILFSPDAKAAPQPTPKPTPKPNGSYSSGSHYGSGAQGLVSVALSQIGDRYVWGATGPGSFDCSGLVYYSLNHSGVHIGRYNAAGFSRVSSWTRVSSVGSLRRGDLIFFKSDKSSRVSHTAIYLGGGRFVHASSSKGRVMISSFGPYWYRNFVCGRRVF
ncbi:MAG: peptidoglycan-binding protein [Bacillota bacterium]